MRTLDGMTVGKLRELLANVPDDTRITLSIEGTWVPLSKIVVDEVAYSAGPSQPAQVTRLEV